MRDLNPDPDGPVTQIGPPCRLDRVVVAVDDPVEVSRDHLDDLVQVFMVELAIVDESWQRDRGKVADSGLIAVRVPFVSQRF